jgi:hypothetical protein
MTSPTEFPASDKSGVPDDSLPRTPALSEAALGWARRGIWAVCVAVYLIVFIGGIQSGGEELSALGRAAGFTVVAAVLGRIGLGLLAGATVAGEAVPMDDEEGRLGPDLEGLGNTNVSEQEDEATAA